MNVIYNLFAFYPVRSSVMLVALLAAGLFEGLSLTALLPLIETISSDSQLENDFSSFDHFFRSFFEYFGVDVSLASILAIIVVCTILKSLLLLGAHQQVGYTSARVATDFRLRLIDALSKTKWNYFVSRQTGALANSLATEATRAASSFEQAGRFVAFLLQAFVYFFVALTISWQATLISIFCGFAILGMFKILLQVSQKAGAKQTNLLNLLLTDLTDLLGCFKALKAMRREEFADELLKNHSGQLERAMRKEVISREALRNLQEPVLAFFAAFGLFVAIEIWKMQLSEMMILVFLLLRLLGLLNKALQRYQFLLVNRSAFEAIEKRVFEASQQAEKASGTLQLNNINSIVLKNITFSYGEKKIFEGFNALFPMNSLNVLAAPSGSGKTTLLDIIAGLLTPLKGRVLVEGKELTDIDLNWWRANLGYVPQELELLHQSIKLNISVGIKWLNDDSIINALRRVGMMEYVESLDNGLDTIVGERGKKLSGGQRQRIIIARALAHSPKILLLDEPTSSLDTESASHVIELLKDLASSLTIIVASHDNKLIEKADNVIFLNN
ncbi:MAG: ABC transporter ATP-binding protein [Pseudomonadota bacterium]|nr:ABC transporter ATP-binding protein [Pseudomonadota bacterium]